MAATLSVTERAERLEGAVADIAAAVERLGSGEDWRGWLALSARLGRRHRYSARNMIWLWEQAMARGVELSVVGGYRWWQSIGRQVRKGERAYRVLAPVTRRLPDPDEPGRTVPTVVGWRIESTFSLEQTDGDELAEPPAMVMPTGDGPEGAWDALAGLLDAGGWQVEREAIDGATQGYTQWAGRRVVVRPDLDPAGAFYVLCHEAAHVHCHEKSPLDRAVKEVEADSIAYLIAAALGVDTSGATFGYVTGWANGDPQAVLDVAGRVTAAAAAILDALAATSPKENSPQSPAHS